MAIFTLVSATGSPGVTTSAIGLALAWPRDVVLVDGDRCASQAVLAGYLGGVATGGRGLTSLAQAYRDGIDLTTDLPSHLVPLGEPAADGPQRRFLPGFARPGSARLFEQVWPELLGALDDLDRQGTDVIIDAGRWGSQGLPPSVIAYSRCVALVTRSSLRSLAALRLYLPDVDKAVGGASGCFAGLFVVNPGAPYAAGEIAAQFGLPVWAEVPWQPDDAAGLSDGAQVRGRPANRPLARSFAVASAGLRVIAERWDERMTRLDGGPRAGNAVQADAEVHAEPEVGAHV